jgi:hypothetical protein
MGLFFKKMLSRRCALIGRRRMTDFALWATACESALWPARTFTRAYENNRRVAIDDAIEADPVAAPRARDQGQAQHLDGKRRRPAAGWGRSCR